MSLDPNKLDLYGDFAKIISIISIIIAIASLIVALFSMLESRFEWLKQLLKIPMQFLGFY